VAETVNIAEVATKLSDDIFTHFLWSAHPLRDANFACVSEKHSRKDAHTHPGDVVFSYDDPYLGKRMYLHTDLKSYSKESLTTAKLKSALVSLGKTVECARASDEWRELWSAPTGDPFEIHGLLFVHNHDHAYSKSFAEAVQSVGDVQCPANVVLHFLGPEDISRLHSIAFDLLRLKMQTLKGKGEYTFWYPDLVLTRRHGDIWGQSASIEYLTGPHLFVRYRSDDQPDTGGSYLIYYNRPAATREEFVYFLDALSRFQLLEEEKSITVRVTHPLAGDKLASTFHAAKEHYAKAWGFDERRRAILSKIQIDRLTILTDNLNINDMGWR
jgi:hypothetical protein